MAISENDIELIERSLKGNLNKEESILFKERMKSDDFTQEVSLHRTMISAIKLEDKKLLREELKRNIRVLKFTSEKKKSPNKYYLVAATASFLVIAAYIILPSNRSLFESYYSPFPENPITRSDTALTDNYSLAMQQYSIGNYEKALNGFLSIKNNALQDEISLYIGNCYLSISKPELAVTYLKRVEISVNIKLQTHAQWFLALAYLHSGNNLKATEELNAIIANESTYSDMSVSLLTKLSWTFY